MTYDVTVYNPHHISYYISIQLNPNFHILFRKLSNVSTVKYRITVYVKVSNFIHYVSCICDSMLYIKVFNWIVLFLCLRGCGPCISLDIFNILFVHNYGETFYLFFSRITLMFQFQVLRTLCFNLCYG